jgi:hypothetical protein
MEEATVLVRIDEDWEAGRMYARPATEDEFNRMDGSVIVSMKQREYKMIELATDMFNVTQRYLSDIYTGITNDDDEDDAITFVENTGDSITVDTMSFADGLKEMFNKQIQDKEVKKHG